MKWLAALLALSAASIAEDNAARWNACKVNPAWSITLDKLVTRFERNRPRYAAIEKAHANGVPASVLFGLHEREASGSFSCSLAQGDPLTHRSRNVPRGRLPDKAPPYTWEECAIDAVYNVDRLDKIEWRVVGRSLDGIENYNGSGYRRKGIPSPYVWSGTNQYARGKYVSDGRYSSTFVDQQPGVAAILKRMQERGIPMAFDKPPFRPATINLR